MKKISIVCQSLPEEERPQVSPASLVPPDESVSRLSRVHYDMSGLAAVWAAVQATRLEGDWPLFDLRSEGARGTVHVLESWRFEDPNVLRRGFLVLARLGLVCGNVDEGYRFTDAGAKLVTS